MALTVSDISDIASAVWGQIYSDHDDPSTFGSLMGVLFPEDYPEHGYSVMNSVTSAMIEGVRIEITPKSAPTYIVWKGTTDILGDAKDQFDNGIKLPSGSYFINRFKAGLNFDNPDTETIL